MCGHIYAVVAYSSVELNQIDHVHPRSKGAQCKVRRAHHDFQVVERKHDDQSKLVISLMAQNGDVEVSWWSNCGVRRGDEARTCRCSAAKLGYRLVCNPAWWTLHVPRGPHLWCCWVHWRCHTSPASPPTTSSSWDSDAPHSSSGTGTPSPHATPAPPLPGAASSEGSLPRSASATSSGTRWSPARIWSCCSSRLVPPGRGGAPPSRVENPGTGSSGSRSGFLGLSGSRDLLGETSGSSNARLESSELSCERLSEEGTPACSSSLIASSGLSARTLCSLEAGSAYWSSHSVLLSFW